MIWNTAAARSQAVIGPERLFVRRATDTAAACSLVRCFGWSPLSVLVEESHQAEVCDTCGQVASTDPRLVRDVIYQGALQVKSAGTVFLAPLRPAGRRVPTLGATGQGAQGRPKAGYARLTRRRRGSHRLPDRGVVSTSALGSQVSRQAADREVCPYNRG